MTSREQDKSDFDLETFVDLFDTAMSSDNPAVQRALKNLLMIATLVDSDTKLEGRVRGPLRRLVDDIQNLNRRLSQLESGAQQARPYPNVINTPWVTTQPNPSVMNPHWVTTQPNTAIPGSGNWPPGTIIGGGGLTSGTFSIAAQGASSTAYDDQYKSSDC